MEDGGLSPICVIKVMVVVGEVGMWWIILAAGFAQPLPGQSSSECLIEVATALEPSGDRAGDVASATVTACAVTRPAIQPGSLYSQMTREEREHTDRIQDQMDYEKALLTVIRLRACRKTPGCIISKLGRPMR